MVLMESAGPAGMPSAGGRAALRLLKTTTLPAGIWPMATEKRTGLALPRTPNQEATMPAARSVWVSGG